MKEEDRVAARLAGQQSRLCLRTLSETCSADKINTMSEATRSILEMIRHLPVDERVELADEVDRLTWCDRMKAVAERIHEQAKANPITDEEIDQIVDEVRSETSLYERYWTRRRSSAP